MISLFARLCLPVSLLLSAGIQAQEHIPLSNDEIQQFGIAFSPVQIMDGDTGMQVRTVFSLCHADLHNLWYVFLSCQMLRGYSGMLQSLTRIIFCIFL